jgi:hypothetical protein
MLEQDAGIRGVSPIKMSRMVAETIIDSRNIDTVSETKILNDSLK